MNARGAGFCASRVMYSSMSRPTVIIRSANSSIMMTMRGRRACTNGVSFDNLPPISRGGQLFHGLLRP